MKKVVINDCFGGYGLSEEAYKFLGLTWDRYGYAYENYTDRCDPKLVECVETLGEKASGSCANLVVKEYDETKFSYWISDYDGAETLYLEPIVRKSVIRSMSHDEIIDYLESLNIQVVD